MEEVSPDTCSSHVCHVLGGFQYFQSMTSYPPVFYPFLFNLLYFAIGKAFKWRRLISFLLSLSLSPLSLSSGPWYVGEVLKGVYGLIFVHGVITETHYIPGSLTYIHGAVEVSTSYCRD